ncbi:MAG: calcium-binding protein, partial [Marmoricola sp.]
MKRRNLVLLTTLPLAAAVLVASPTTAAVPQCNGLDATIVGTNGADHLTGTDGPDVVVLGSGADTFIAKGGDDVICGGSGADVIYPGAGNDTVFGETGSDRIVGSGGNDTLNGGGDVRDTLSYSDSGAKHLRLDLRIKKATKDGGSDTFTGFARYTGTTGADTLIGTTTDDYLRGNGGDDIIWGFGGNDHLLVDRGAPVVHAGDGNDGVSANRTVGARIDLGSGTDTLLFTQPGAGNRWSGGAGVDTLRAHGTRMEINLNQSFVRVYLSGARSSEAGFENVDGTYSADRIVGNGVANRLRSNGDRGTL